MVELVRETDQGMREIGKFMAVGEGITLDQLCDLSGWLHFVGCRLGTLSIERPNDPRLKELLQQCAALQAQCMEQAQAMGELQRGSTLH
ncbi:hypothetical protein SAMN05443245_5862 [Paraburkholderia fungorum]|uniref:Uncharacterized protein n=1 Tax=Paraburkholderia fungorum TaxID=134537 RepID=A0A1H1IZ02_9BURK|nr:hypothetical protein [Paraburkholderia fungorum]SDR42586.1 hypothetical protein SAMN05443245_5862 [Paraburkholderia fungorum]